MDNFARVFPFLWPYRRKLLLSVIFALLVALFWGANLSLTFPIVKVLMQDKNLVDSLDEEIGALEKELPKLNERLQQVDDEYGTPPQRRGMFDRGEESSEKAKHEARRLSELSDASQRLMVLKWVKSYVMPWVPRDKFDTLALLFGILIFATLLKGIAIFVQDVLIGSVVELGVMGIRKECYRQTLALDYQSLSMKGTAELMSRFTNDVNVMSSGLLLLGGKVIREPLKATVCILIAFWVNWRLTVVSLLFVPMMGAVFYRYGKILKRASHRMMESMSRIYKSLEETFAATKIMIAFDAGRRHRQRFHRENREYYGKAMKVVQVDALTSPTTELLGMLSICIALLPGAYLVLRDTTHIWGVRLSTAPMSVSQLMLLYSLLAGTIDPIRKLSSVYAKLKRSAAGADRIFALIDQPSLVKQSADPLPLPRPANSVTFKKISFTYAANNGNGHDRQPALDGVSLKVSAGEVVAIVGENGSGKTTLVNLLPRFFDPDHGAVLLDGIDIRRVRLRDLRNQIGVVTQETLLVDDTIYENIRYGSPDATPAELEAAARKAHVTQFAEQLPNGFDFRVGANGQLLSGGQRQRIALARAIVRDPAILILDEATSAIDAQSESEIQEVLGKFVKGRTTFLITHSLNRGVLNFATRIVLMVNGRVVADGPHQTLLATSTVYQEFYNAQLRRQSDNPSVIAVNPSPSDIQSMNVTETASVDHKRTTETEPHVIPFKNIVSVEGNDLEPAPGDYRGTDLDTLNGGKAGTKKTAN